MHGFANRGEAWARNGFLVFVLIFMSAPIVLVIVNSFNASAISIWPPAGWTTNWYTKLAANAGFRTGLWNSLLIASLSTALTLLVSIPAAFALERFRFPGRQMLASLFRSPLVVPRVVIGFSMFILFITMKLPGFGSWLSISLVHSVLTLPIAISILTASIMNIDQSLAEAARDLGANRFTAFRLVVLPQIRSAMAVAAAFSFITSFDEVETTLFLASPSVTTLPIEMYHYLEFQQDPLIAAASTVLVVGTLFVVMIALLLGKVRSI